jgi:glucokinase
MTNLKWTLDAVKLKYKLQVERIRLLNDMEAMATGMFYVPENELVELNSGATPETGNIAVIAAGTGLGEAILYWDGNKHLPIATEGGHCDFAPQNPLQDKLLVYLRQQYPEHVSYERILSGNGFGLLYDFLFEQGIEQARHIIPDDNSDTDRNAIISQLGVSGEDALCQAAVHLFLEIYGAEAGNLALKSLATGGVFIGGGIAPKILPALRNGIFLRTFQAKGRYSAMLKKISIKISTREQTPLLGAINYY